MQGGGEDTVNAAAVVLAAAARSSTGLRPQHHHHHLEQQHHDHDPAAATKKRWWSRLSATLCFRPHGHAHPRRVIAASYADGDTPPRPVTGVTHTASASAYVHQAPPAHPVFAFAAPPSSPASSLFQSEAPSPVLLDLHGTAGSSPSMFAVGPYARGPQQLVSPPVLYSALTTEPSTAPRTPPATTGPSSPEVPFARFVDDGHELLFHHAAYQLRQQGSSVRPLVSPGPEPGSPSSSSPRLFRKLHRRNEQGSLLDGHVPVASCEAADARDQDDDDDEVPDSAGEFVFGHADGGGAAPAEDIDGKNWHFFPMAVGEQHAKI